MQTILVLTSTPIEFHSLCKLNSNKPCTVVSQAVDKNDSSLSIAGGPRLKAALLAKMIWTTYCLAWSCPLGRSCKETRGRKRQRCPRRVWAQVEEDGNDEGLHTPKVTTWGVFPRPQDISRTFGGGRNLPVGGENLSSAEQERKDEETRQRLDAYRRSIGIDAGREEKFRTRVVNAIDQSAKLVQQSRSRDAIRVLESVQGFVGLKSKLGGDLHLALALAYEVAGRQADAANLYKKLVASPHPAVSARAKELSFGFEAMDKLNIDRRKGELPVTSFEIPDVFGYRRFEKGYDTTFMEKSKTKMDKDEAKLRNQSSGILVLLLMCGLCGLILRQSFLP